jgi:outer membrane protein TolC
MNRLCLHLNLKEDLNDQTCLEVNETFLQALKAKQKAPAVKTAIRQAPENCRVTTARHNEPMASFAGVLNTLFLLLRAMTNNNPAGYDFSPSKINLYHAMGEVTFQ